MKSMLFEELLWQVPEDARGRGSDEAVKVDRGQMMKLDDTARGLDPPCAVMDNPWRNSAFCLY